jgi:hypothetical protein
MINTCPRGTHCNFAEYAQALFIKSVMKDGFCMGAKEVPVVFDDPSRNGVTPKEIQQLRRDQPDAMGF